MLHAMQESESEPLRSTTTLGRRQIMTKAIEASGLVKTYPGARRGPRVLALDNLSFSVESGTVFGLLGPNGAGKSTTVKVLTTLSRPDKGTARVAGHDVLREQARVRKAIGCVAQKSGADRDATGRENLILQGLLYQMERPVLEARADELLRRFGLTEAADRVVRTYSGGMQRRLDVALGLIHRPQVLFLDEPTTGLDPEARAEMWSEIKRLTHEGLTILLTTHYLEEADNLASRLAIVDRGRIVAEGTPEELKSEMRGDGLRVSLCDSGDGHVPEAVVRAALDGLPGVRDTVLDGCTLHAHVDNGAQAVPTVLQALEARGVPVRAVTISRPSLDDVYLQHTGRTFESADADTPEVKR